MITETIAATNAAGSSTQTKSNKQLDRDAFLRLLITELSNQDPMRPMEDKEFIAQLAQFSSLEQMQGMNQTLEAFVQSQTTFQAAGLIGRTVEATDPETGDQFIGKVDSVQFESGKPLLRVQDRNIPLSSVHSVS